MSRLEMAVPGTRVTLFASLHYAGAGWAAPGRADKFALLGDAYSVKARDTSSRNQLLAGSLSAASCQ